MRSRVPKGNIRLLNLGLPLLPLLPCSSGDPDPAGNPSGLLEAPEHRAHRPGRPCAARSLGPLSSVWQDTRFPVPGPLSSLWQDTRCPVSRAAVLAVAGHTPHCLRPSPLSLHEVTLMGWHHSPCCALSPHTAGMGSSEPRLLNMRGASGARANRSPSLVRGTGQPVVAAARQGCVRSHPFVCSEAAQTSELPGCPVLSRGRCGWSRGCRCRQCQRSPLRAGQGRSGAACLVPVLLPPHITRGPL